MNNWERNLDPIEKIIRKRETRMEQAEEALRINKVNFARLGIHFCENCGSGLFTSFAHKRKRRHYRTLEELTDYEEVLLLCGKCHDAIERDPILTKEFFTRLRGQK